MSLRTSYLIEQIIDPNNLRLAFWKASKGKRHSLEVEQYRQNLDENLLRLRQQIQSGLVEVGQYHHFKIYEPKERDICAAAFSEQVLHHALMNICHDHFERYQIFDSYASRKGKGVRKALERARAYNRMHAWYLKLDVSKFFASIHHEVLKGQLRKLFADYRLVDILVKIIDSFEDLPGRGVPIGNLSSQYFANHFLAPLDHFIKEKLRIKAYVRYMDDMVLWAQDPAVLKSAKHAIEDFIATTLQCALKPVQLNRVSRGLPFLGYRLFKNEVRLLAQSKRRFIRKLRYANQQLATSAWSQHEYQRRVRPLFSFVQYANTAAFCRLVLGQSP
jgi:RNA-directed DNA polymerase